jgi:tetratricopeptide (TPR) repeat protein
MQSRELAKAQLLDALASLDPLNDADPRLPYILSNLSAVYFSERTIDDADAIAQRMLLVCQQIFGPTDPHTAAAYNNLGVIWEREKKSDVDTLFKQALEIWQNDGKGPPESRIVALNNLSAFEVRNKLFDQARATASEAVELGRKSELANADMGSAENNLAVVLQHEGRFGEAEELYKEATTIWQKVLGPNHEWVALSLLNLSSLCREQRMHSDAESLYQASMTIRRASPGGSLFDQIGPLTIPAEAEAEGLPVCLIKDDPLNAEDALLNSPDYVSIVRALRRDTLDQLREYVTGLGPWQQNFEIKPGLFTNPMENDPTAIQWWTIEPFVAHDLSGKSVLEIGCNAGFFSLQFKRRGARRVVGIDRDPAVLAQARFISRWFVQNIELRQIDDYDSIKLGEFDYVIVMDAAVSFETIAAACRGTLYLRSSFDGETATDFPTAKAQLEAAGFQRFLDTSSPDTMVCQRNAEAT